MKQDGISPNASRLLWAGFTAILATGVGFGIRGGVLASWGTDFGFTAAQLGEITGAGLTGFCFGIITGGLVCDKIGYGKLVLAAFALHAASAAITLSASPGQDQALSAGLLYWGSFVFAMANGTLESVANPLVATLFPNHRTHYLNILHASWPAGLVLGGLVGWTLGDGLHWSWKAQVALFLVPTIVYGVMFFGQQMPKSEASQKGLKLGSMLEDVGILGTLVVGFLLALFFSKGVGLGDAAGYGIAGALLIAVALVTRFSIGSWLLFVLFLTHALVGSVELGTDSWIQNITGNLLTSEQGKMLFVWSSAIMFGLRFCADLIERRTGLSPVGLLLTCALLACLGLNLLSGIASFAGALFAIAVYAIGKTFFWPTMLAVASDRFPRTGAIAISIMGGIGMMAGGMLGAPGLGYAKDRFAGAALEEQNPAIYAEYRAEQPSHFLFLAETHGLDPRVAKKLEGVREQLAAEGQTDPKAAVAKLSPEERAVHEASTEGDRATLRADAVIPATMAGIYLLLLLYFKLIGGYRAITISDET